MPRSPRVAAAIHALSDGVFSRLAHRIEQLEGEVYPLHVGDTWMDPPVGCRMEDLRSEGLPGLHRYTRPAGHPALIRAASQRWQLSEDRILATAGATGGLSALAGTLLEPGDEVLILAPFWPLIPGIVATRGGRPVEVPYFGRQGSAAERLGPHLTEKTVAIYINSPNNPTGQVLTESELRELVAFARAHDLWIWSDEVYEDYVYVGHFVPLRSLAPERCFTALSFSKAWGMAGNRCGLLLGPEDPALTAEVRKLVVHGFYAASTASQWAATRALQGDGGWIHAARQSYRAVGEAAAACLAVAPPASGTFLFVDVSAHLEGSGPDALHAFLLRCLDRNLVLAPGSSCGAIYADHVRLCFTAAPPDVVMRGVASLALLLGRRGG